MTGSLSHPFQEVNPTTVWSQITHSNLPSAQIQSRTSQTLTFADEALLGDGLLAYITALGLLEWLQLEGVCVDALQLVGLREEEEGRGIRRESAELMPAGPRPTETHLVFSKDLFVYGCTWGFDLFDGL